MVPCCIFENLRFSPACCHHAEPPQLLWTSISGGRPLRTHMKLSNEIRAWIVEQNPEALLADGYEEAIIGVGCQGCGIPVVIYDISKCIEILENRDGMTEEDARDFFYYNTAGGYVGDSGPIFMDPIPEWLEGAEDLHKYNDHE